MCMKTLLAIGMMVFVQINGFAQKLYTKNAQISFFSKTSLENISADNNQVLSTLDLQTGQMNFSVLIKAFHFRKSLMEEHFNENYLESTKFPRALFKGKINNVKIDLEKEGSIPVVVTGDLTIHGVTKNITTNGTIIVKSGILSANAVFKVKLADYNITVPAIVKNNIAETVEVTVSCTYDKKM